MKSDLLHWKVVCFPASVVRWLCQNTNQLRFDLGQNHMDAMLYFTGWRLHIFRSQFILVGSRWRETDYMKLPGVQHFSGAVHLLQQLHQFDIDSIASSSVRSQLMKGVWSSVSKQVHRKQKCIDIRYLSFYIPFHLLAIISPRSRACELPIRHTRWSRPISTLRCCVPLERPRLP